MSKYFKPPAEKLAWYHKHDVRYCELWPPCYYCVHLIEMGNQGPHWAGWTCKAFPDGIPYTIMVRSEDHTEPLLGQSNDIVFESETVDFYDAPNKVTFSGTWYPSDTQRPMDEYDPDEQRALVHVTTHEDSVHVQMTAGGGEGEPIGDFSRVLLPGQKLFGLTYNQWQALGDGAHAIRQAWPTRDPASS